MRLLVVCPFLGVTLADDLHVSKRVENFQNYYTGSVQIPKKGIAADGHRAKSGLLR
jgi:hypothetical protein